MTINELNEKLHNAANGSNEAWKIYGEICRLKNIENMELLEQLHEQVVQLPIVKE